MNIDIGKGRSKQYERSSKLRQITKDHPALPLQKVRKLNWRRTAKEMAVAKENWKEWDATVGDGTDAL